MKVGWSSNCTTKKDQKPETQVMLGLLDAVLRGRWRWIDCVSMCGCEGKNPSSLFISRRPAILERVQN